MKFTRNTVMFFLSLIVTGLTGCATTKPENHAAGATHSVQSVENDYQQVATQVDATNSSLQNLISPNQIDLKKRLDEYKSNVSSMENLGAQLNKDSAEMREQRQDYFAEWEKRGDTYTNPQIRALSEQRRLEMQNVFAQIPEASIGVKGSLDTYLNDIKEIQAYLSNDLNLTPKGIEAVTPVAQRAMQKGNEVKASVRPVLAAINRVQNIMAQGGTGSGTAAGGEQPENQPVDQQQPQYRQPTENR